MTRLMSRIAAWSAPLAPIALAATASAATTGTWTMAPSPPEGISTMLLLTDGTIMAQSNGGTAWYRLAPGADGLYAHGSWSARASMHDSRLYYASTVLRDGRVFVGGGEYGTGTGSVEVYDPLADAWSYVGGWSGDIGDSTGITLADGRVLMLPRGWSGGVVWNPADGSWTGTGGKRTGNDEESALQLPDGSVLAVTEDDASMRWLPWTNAWVDAGAVPNGLIGHGEEMGAAVLMRDGRVLALGANGATDLYRTWDGAWNAGPWMPDGARADDAPAAVLPNGRVLLAGDLGDFASPTEMLEFDPTTDSLLRAPTPAGAQISEPAFVERFLVAPSGEVLYASGGAVFAYACGDGPADAWRPTIAGIAANGDGTAHVTGAQLNGLTGGAYYGDDAQMASNFPVARLTDGAGTVRYARTSGFSTMGVATGSATVSCEVSFAGIPDGSYALAIVADGIASGAVPVDVRGGAFGSGGGDVIGDGAGLLGEYWSAHDRSFDGAPTASRTDATVDFDWGPGSPDASVSSDHFTARWTGQVLAPRDGAYTVTVVGDDGVRLWIDGQLVIDAWYDEAPTAHSGGVTLARGTRHDVRLEYYEDGGGAVARLLWTLPGDGQAATVPSTQLYPATSGSGGGSGLTGEYWSNQLATFDGSPTVTRVDADVDFDWGSGSPDPSVTSDHFTARWTGQVLAPSDGTYAFTVVGDDGVRLWIDGQPVIDAWYDEAPTAHDGSVTLAAGTRHDVRLDYYEDGGGAVARLLWTTPGASGSAVVPTSALFPASPTGTGLTAQYWSDQLATFDGAPTLTRVDPTVDFDWGSGSPDGSISSDDFSARWTGQVLAPATDDYTFAVTGDDGVRLWVGGRLVIDAWYDQPPTRYTATVRLTGGQRPDVRLDFYEHAGGATARLHWSSSAIADQAIPTVDLFPAAPAAAWEPAPPTAAQ